MNVKIFDRDELPHKLLLKTRQKAKLRNEFENNMLTKIKLSKTQKIIQSAGFLGSLLSQAAGQFIDNIYFSTIGITVAASAIDTGI